ncbi:MAG: hypothetical protein ACOYBJ_03235 [Patescibacteria group bacterium]|jgi:hypothetical protein
MDSTKLQDELENVATTIERIEARERSWIFWVWRGILVGIGSTVGVVVVLYGSLYLAQRLTGVPLLGRVAEMITPYIEQSVSDRIERAERVFEEKETATTPAQPTTQRASDTAALYSLELPATWTIEVKEGARGTQRSRLEAESPDFRTRVGTTAQSRIEAMYYDAGVKLTVVTTKASVTAEADDSLDVIEERTLTVAGETATYRSYREESIASGRLIEAQFTHEGNHYTLTMAYNPDKYPEGPTVFEKILQSFSFKTASAE